MAGGSEDGNRYSFFDEGHTSLNLRKVLKQKELDMKLILVGLSSKPISYDDEHDSRKQVEEKEKAFYSHPVDDIVQETVRVEYVSEEEEIRRYYSTFS